MDNRQIDGAKKNQMKRISYKFADSTLIVCSSLIKHLCCIEKKVTRCKLIHEMSSKCH